MSHTCTVCLTLCLSSLCGAPEIYLALPVYLMWCLRHLFGFACLQYVVLQRFIWLCLSTLCGAPEIYLALPVYLMWCSRHLFGFACLPYVVLQTFIWLCLSTLCGAPQTRRACLDSLLMCTCVYTCYASCNPWKDCHLCSCHAAHMNTTHCQMQHMSTLCLNHAA